MCDNDGTNRTLVIESETNFSVNETTELKNESVFL